MAIPINHRVQFGLESTRGTAVTATLEQAVKGDGFRPTLTNNLGQVMPSSTFPYRGDSVPVGVTASLAMTVDANITNIRDLILMATKRTAGVLPAFTIIDGQQGVGVARYSGGVCRQMTLGFSGGATPGEDSVLSVSHEFETMLAENAQGALASLTQAHARRFQLRHSTFTVNGVAATKITAMNLVVANALSLGRPDATNKRIFLEDGNEETTIRLTAQFAAAAWRALVEASTEIPVVLVLATGSANETVTATIAKAQVQSRTVAEGDGVVTEEIEIVPHYGSAAPVVWTYGSSIGASVVGL